MTSRMAAKTHRFVCQGYHLLQKTKTPKPNDAIPFGCSWAPAFNALASVNIQDDLCFAILAPDRQASGLRLLVNAKQPVIAPALRACDPSVYYR